MMQMGMRTAYELVVRELSSGNEKVYERVLEYYFSKTGNKLLFEQAGDSAGPRKIIYCDLESGKLTVLSNGGNDFRSFTLSDDGSQVAYVAEREAGKKDLVKYYKLWYYRTGMDSAEWVVDKNTIGMRLGMTVSEYGNIRFSRSGRRLFFGSAPVPVPRDTTIIDMDMPTLDVWHYKDDYLQPMQKVPARLQAARQENYLSMLDLDSRRVRQLGSREIPQVLLTNEGDGDMFVGISDFGKRIESQWMSSSLTDIYSIDVNTGFKMLVKENLQGSVYPSPGGHYIMWYDQKAREYFAWDGHRVKNLTEKIRPALWSEEFDMPDHPSNYGIMGWHAGDSAVYVYDRFDVWAIDLATGDNPRIITGNGRSDKTRYRYIKLDTEERFIGSDNPVFFSYFREDTKQAGLVMGRIGKMTVTPATLTGGDYSFGQVRKAKQAPQLIYTKENFTLPPDIYLLDAIPTPGDGNLSSARPNRETRLSSINPQQADYLWGSAELFNWKAYNGKNATGIVYKPDHFDPKKKYPVIVYFYEKLSQNLFDYKEPGPIRSEVNISCMVSNGYIVFIPDIEYRIGFPGQSAYDYVVSGARALVKRGWADSTRMAIQGHSWGGYQAAQLATMTNLFRAVWAGAPVSNMTSAYGGIRWESGRSRQFQYEKAQSRIGATLWERPDLYIRNSPLFQLDKVTAPMVILHNDEDGAVPWYQGIELFTGLRRLGKPVWLLNYNGQGHGLSQRKDMKDYYIRMQQFFDYMLKGARPARWITEGVPAVRKGKDWGLELD
ncbi:MAG: prolyl oligopeptidase family serine peptidase [Chitinophagaceae bacterium]